MSIMQSTSVSGGLINASKKYFFKEGEILLNATSKCEELWDEMRKADFRQEGFLNEKNIQLIFENKFNVIEDLLRITSVEEFMEVFDDDLDGLLNEDEQILIFSIIKERIRILAEEICIMKKYDLYKDMMKEVRGIEQLIVKYQNELRKNVHKKQMDDYIKIGEEIKSDFEYKWNKKFINLNEKSKKELKEKEYNLRLDKEDKYKTELNKILNQTKIKPSNKVRVLQNQEKLVAINERIEEAANYRNELKVIEKKDEARLKRLNENLVKNLKKELDREEKKEMNKLINRLDYEKNKLTINKNTKTNILNKQINLHVNDIKRIQNQLSNIYLDVAKKSDEMNRAKERQRQTNKVLSAIKSIKNGKGANNFQVLESKKYIALALLGITTNTPLTLNTSIDSFQYGNNSLLKAHVIALKYIIKNFRPVCFDINSDYSNRKFCNVIVDDGIKKDKNLKRKIRILLDQRKHKDEVFVSPTCYYDDNLNEIKSEDLYLPTIIN